MTTTQIPLRTAELYRSQGVARAAVVNAVTGRGLPGVKAARIALAVRAEERAGELVDAATGGALDMLVVAGGGPLPDLIGWRAVRTQAMREALDRRVPPVAQAEADHRAAVDRMEHQRAPRRRDYVRLLVAGWLLEAAA